MILKGDVVQFNEKHKWCGALGIVADVSIEKRLYMIGVPIPLKGDAYVCARPGEIEYIGRAVLVPIENTNTESEEK